jgi:hypothetical protein
MKFAVDPFLLPVYCAFRVSRPVTNQKQPEYVDKKRCTRDTPKDNKEASFFGA